MAESSLLLILLLAALGIHGAVSLMNAALQNLSRADMRLRADDGDARAQRYLALMDSGLQLSMTVSIAHILTRFAIAVILVLLVIEPLANGDAGVRALLAVATIVLGAGLTLVIGDLATGGDRLQPGGESSGAGTCRQCACCSSSFRLLPRWCSS